MASLPAMWGPGESSMWHEFQFFCAVKGYGVIYCNPCGSGGYGLDFLRANVKRLGNRSGPIDVLMALDKTVAEVVGLTRSRSWWSAADRTLKLSGGMDRRS